MRAFLLVAVLSAMVLVQPAQALMAKPNPSLYDLAALQTLCNSTYDVDVGICAGYIMGIADTLQQQGQACLSRQITPETLLENVRRDWQKMDADPAMPALQNIQDSLLQRFPCR